MRRQNLIGNRGAEGLWCRCAGAVAVVLVLMGLAQVALAQSTTYRLEIRRAEVVDDDYNIFFSLLGSNQEAIKKVDLPNLKLLSGDNQEEVPIGDPQIKLLADTPRPVAVMFVVANYRSFNQKNTRSRAAAQEFVARMRNIDVAGFVHYGTSYRDMEFTQDVRTLSDQISTVKDGDDPEPRIFAALGQALRRFDRDLDQQSIDLRYLVIISDGAGGWVGLSDQSRVDKKISSFVKKAQDLRVTPLVIGYAPLGQELDEDKLTMLRQLASRGRGTYREASDPEAVFSATEAAYNEIYGTHVWNFRSNALPAGQSHKVRLATTVNSIKLKSPPESIYIPEAESNLVLILSILGGLCLLIGLGAAITFGVGYFIKKRRENDDEEDYEEEYYEGAPAAAPGAVQAVGAVAPALAAAAPQYDDEPPATYLGKLHARTGPLHGRNFYIVDETTTIGSADSNSIILGDSTVSKKHAGIRVREGNRYELHDFGSTNGLFINDRRISKQFLKNGDIIKIGDTELIFTVE